MSIPPAERVASGSTLKGAAPKNHDSQPSTAPALALCICRYRDRGAIVVGLALSIVIYDNNNRFAGNDLTIILRKPKYTISPDR
jgi:hypothetical protein